jgi:hypothetical protein
MGIIVYVSNKPFVSDFNALQRDNGRILKMSFFNSIAGDMSSPTTWQTVARTCQIGQFYKNWSVVYVHRIFPQTG